MSSSCAALGRARAHCRAAALSAPHEAVSSPRTFQRSSAEGSCTTRSSLWRRERRESRSSLVAQIERRPPRGSCERAEERLDADLAEGRQADLVGELEALVREYPLRERLRELLLVALYRSGRQAEALAAYQDARAALVDELGIEPGKALRELHQAILRQDAALDLVPADRPASETGRGIFVGREAEFAQLAAGLDDALAGRGRLFFLVGEPGIGKSRLADELIRAAHAIAASRFSSDAAGKRAAHRPTGRGFSPLRSYIPRRRP